VHLTSSLHFGICLGGSATLYVPFCIAEWTSPVTTKSLYIVPAPFTPVSTKPTSVYSRFAHPTARVIGGFGYIFKITKLQPEVQSFSAPMYLPALFYFNNAFSVTFNTRKLLLQHLTVVCILCPSKNAVGLLPSFCYLHQDTHSSYKKLAVLWFNEALCLVSSSVVADSFRLRNRQLLVAAKRYGQGYNVNKIDLNV